MPRRYNDKRVAANLEAMKSKLPRIIARKVLKNIEGNFAKEGFTDRSFTRWPKRKTLNPSDRREKARTRTSGRTPRARKLLVDTGALVDSIDVRAQSWRIIRVGSYGIPYAKYHNRKDARVERPFARMGLKLKNDLRKTVRTEIKKALK